ncbi:serine/threonine-protein kinase pim-1-like [Ictalurus furcatus]|uniref:serine/threonine-protein kinase pim-1-like n=1 Tax=Ictalurus furcatus TaxID=66913 RepID=UPI00234FED2E|nr:serine/threonine-protein kinase pim-1-like [Ictalurus furcatus]
MREAFERTEVYEYALWLNSGFTQPNFQIFKLLHAGRLADSGHSAQARNYCRTIATAVATFPSNITVILMSRLIRLSEELYRGKAKEPNWLVNLRYLCLHKVEQIPGKDYIIPEQQEVWDVDSQSQGLLTAEKFTLHLTAMELQAEMWDEDSESDGSLMPETSTTYVNTSELQPEVWDVDSEVQEMPTFHPSCLKFLTEPEAQRFLALYTMGDILGSGGFGTVYEGTCKKDGQQVAIKYIAKDASDFYIPIPGESCKLLLEVALMQIVSKPPHNKNVLQLLDWFDMPDCFLLVLERPVPCMDVYNLCMSQKGVLDEPLAKIIMWQVVEAARYCHNRGVFHRDIKAENLLFNTDTMEVKLIDFGCGDLWQDTPYEEYAGTPDFWPPEWILQQEYNAYPATVWSLGILLFSIVCGEMPFMTDEEVVAGTLHFKPGLSKACHHLIEWCLEQDPNKRPSLQQISEHEWFTEDL